MSRDDYDSGLSSTVMSIIEGAADGGGSRRALERFIDQYGKPLNQYLVKSCRLSETDAEETLHDFLVEKLLGSNLEQNIARRYLAKRETFPNIRFRAYLLVSLRNFATDRHRATRLKTIELSELEGFEPLDSSIREELDIFSYEWAHNLVHQAIGQVREFYCSNDERIKLWRVFDARILRPTLCGDEPLNYERMCDEFAFRSPKQAANRLQTVIRRFRQVLRQLVVDYMPVNVDATEEQIAMEMNDLRLALSRPAPSSESNSDPEIQLFELSDACDTLWNDEEVPVIWRQLLSLPLPDLLHEIDPILADKYRFAGNEWKGAPLACLDDLWKHPAAPTDLLEALKRSTKRPVRSDQTDRNLTPSQLPTVINAIVYLTCISVAKLSYNLALSSHTDDALVALVDRILQVSWLDQNTRSVLSQARAQFAS